jgi:Spy/CpxP family protein refolding chaperone
MISKAGFVASALSLTAITFVGCAEQSEPAPVMASHEHGHDEHEHAETLPEVLGELTELRDTVRDAFAKDDGEAAHGPLHDVGHVLEEVSELAGEAHLSDEAIATIESNVEILLDAFGAVDKGMHSEDEGSAYSEVSDKIDTAIAAIAAAAAPALQDDDGHEHGDHDEHGEHDGHKDGDHDEKHDDDHDKSKGHDHDDDDKHGDKHDDDDHEDDDDDDHKAGEKAESSESDTKE